MVQFKVQALGSKFAAMIPGMRLPVVGCVLMVTLFGTSSAQQDVKVGVVLSGGGARGAAHVGFLQALEEAGIQVDCMVGSSIGALIGGYYAAGWSPEEMQQVLESGEFNRRISGSQNAVNSFKQDAPDAAVLDVRVASQNKFLKSNLVSSLALDWSLMEELSPANALAKGDFDGLWIPYRAVASDVLAKKDTVFSRGDLARSIRASISFPFYLHPVWMDGRPMYDGGLYNNLPIDVMIREFDPDVILVSSVESDAVDFGSDDFLSQLEALIVSAQPAMESTGNTVFIRPELAIETFDFEGFAEAVKAGRNATINVLTNNDLAQKIPRDSAKTITSRTAYRSRLPDFEVESCSITGLLPDQSNYAEGFLVGRQQDSRAETLKNNLVLLDSDEHIGRIDPLAQWDSALNRFHVALDIQAEKELLLQLGGSIATHEAGFGYVGAAYQHFGRWPIRLKGSVSFGAFYNAGRLGVRLDSHRSLPFAAEAYALRSRFQYSRTFATFFEEVNPRFLIAQDDEIGAKMLFPAGNQGQFSVEGAAIRTVDLTYPDWLFNPLDTSDRESFEGRVIGINWIQDGRNRSQLARSGSFSRVRLQRFVGESEGLFKTNEGEWESINKQRIYYRFRADGEWYFSTPWNRLRWGFKGALALTDELLRSTYRSTLAQAFSFQPLLGSQSLFLESFRAYNFAGGGVVMDAELRDNLFLRGEVYAFQAMKGIYQAEKGPAYRNAPPTRMMAGIRCYSDFPIGPISIGIEYYERERAPWFFEFLWGFRIYQSTARH